MYDMLKSNRQNV
jgi:clathrin heavy chain